MRSLAFAVLTLVALLPGQSVAGNNPWVAPVVGAGVSLSGGGSLVKVGAKGGLFEVGRLEGGGFEAVLPVTVGVGSSTVFEVFPGVEYHHPLRHAFSWYGDLGVGFAHAVTTTYSAQAGTGGAKGQPAPPPTVVSTTTSRTDFLTRVGVGVSWNAASHLNVYLEPVNMGFYSRAPMFVEYAAFLGASYTF